MKLEFLGGAREVGRSAVLVNGRLLLDYGMKAATPPQFPVGSVAPEAVVVSHGHLDHVGAVPALLSGDARPAVHWTPPTRELAMTLARDTLKLHGVAGSGATGGSWRRRRHGGTYGCPFTETELRRLTQVSQPHGYGESFEAAGHELTLYDAGHIPGSAHVLIDDGETRMLYTGDFHTSHAGRGQRLVAPSTARPDADVVVCESTYSDTDHDPRERVEERFAESVRRTLWNGGTVVVPAFAIGRTQELLMVCAAHDIDCYVDGMGKGVTEMCRRHPEFVRDGDALDRAAARARFVTGRDGQRKRIAAESTAIITTSGMPSGGPAMTYIPEIRANPANMIAMTGHQVAGTPGRELLDTGRAEIDGRVMAVSAQVEAYNFSAHADRDGLLEFLDSYRGAELLCVHGDRCPAFAADLRESGFDADAPERGETVVV